MLFFVITPQNAKAQLVSDPQAPCSEVIDEILYWGAVKQADITLPCGCYVTFSFFSTMDTYRRLHVSIADYAVKYPDGISHCEHDFKEKLPSHHTRDFGDIDLRTFLEIRLTEHLSNKDGEVYNGSVISTKASCYTHHFSSDPDRYVNILKSAHPIEWIDPGTISPGKINIKNTSDRTLSNLIKFHFNEFHQACPGDVCCFYELSLKWEAMTSVPVIEPDKYQFVRYAHKTNLENYENIQIDCPSQLCEYSCTNIDYEYDMYKIKEANTLQDINKSVTLNISPNPASNEITSKLLNSSDNQKYNIEIVDLLGNKVASYTITSQNVNQLDVSKLNNGTYIVNLTKDSQTITSNKILISK